MGKNIFGFRITNSEDMFGNNSSDSDLISLKEESIYEEEMSRVFQEIADQLTNIEE